jgi:hypothetical protein
VTAYAKSAALHSKNHLLLLKKLLQHTTQIFSIQKKYANGLSQAQVCRPDADVVIRMSDIAANK